MSPARLIGHLVGCERRSLSACYPSLPSPSCLGLSAWSRSEDLGRPGPGDPNPVDLLLAHLDFRTTRAFPALRDEAARPDLAAHPWFPEPRWLFAHMVWHWSYHSGQIGLPALQSDVDYEWTTSEGGHKLPAYRRRVSGRPTCPGAGAPHAERISQGGRRVRLRMRIVDAFAETAFTGNPAAVVELEEWLPDEAMQAVASENNLSETAFFRGDASGVYDIRWFSPLREIAFCGHATLASAFTILEGSGTAIVRFRAPVPGELTVRRTEPGVYEMDFPRMDPSPVPDGEVPADLLEGLARRPSRTLVNRQACFAVYEDESHVREADPDLGRITRLGPRDLVVTAPGRRYDFVSRYFDGTIEI